MHNFFNKPKKSETKLLNRHFLIALRTHGKDVDNGFKVGVCM